MTDTVLAYQDLQTLTITGLSTLANGSTATSPAVTSADGTDYLVAISLTSGAGATAGSVVSVFLSSSIDGVDYDDVNNLRRLRTVVFPSAGAQTRTVTVSVAGRDGLPPYWKLVFRNSTGDALTDATVGYRGVARSDTAA